MSAFPNPGLTAPPTSGGIPQWFTQGGNQRSWFPGAPQFNLSMSNMLAGFNALDPEFNQLETDLGAYGKSAQKGILQGGRVATTNAAGQLAAGYNPNDPGAASGLVQPGAETAGIDEYAAKRMGLSDIMAQAKQQASQVPGQIAQTQQQIANQYRQGQIRSLQEMINTISNAAGSQYGYQQAQLGADRGQIALGQAQSREQAQNLSTIMNMVLNGPLGALNNYFSATGGSPGLDFGSQMQSLESSGMGSGYGTGALLQTEGL